MIRIKLKGGALYVAVIISILISIILSLFIVVAYYNIQSVQSQNSLMQLHYSLDSGFEMAKSNYYNSNLATTWQKMPYNNDSIIVNKMPWGCFTLIDVKAKNNHFRIRKTGLFGTLATTDTALMITEQNKPIGLAGHIKFKGMCYLPKAGIKTAYIEGSSFSDLNSLRPFIKPAPNYIPEIDENYLKSINVTQSELNSYTDSLISFIPETLNQSFENKTAVIQSGDIALSSQILSNNIKIISSDLITVENTCQLNNILLVARKVIFKKGFKGTVHVIAKDSIVTEDECEFNYPSSFCVIATNKVIKPSIEVKGIFFGKQCKLKGGLLASNNNNQTSRMMIKLNKDFELIGNLYCSDYADLQGKLFGTIICKTILLQTESGTYDSHLLNSILDPKRYGKNLTVPTWFSKNKYLSCAQWF
ncbi:MAG: hypothetical protein C0448_14230 [Sphingobacteriaceae bacterium]|nr:hypothetical protein [Sphingobacteriaceae bacterium]